jgi:hypothetical protein
MRDGLEGVFDLVETTFRREDGRLARISYIAVNCQDVRTLESYLRDMFAVATDYGRCR